MDNLGLPLPEKIMEALQINTSDIEEKRLNLPTYSDLLKVKTISSINGLTVPFTIVDVREPTEFENFSIDNSINIPLKHLVERMSLIESRKKELVVCVCRVGMRSATAASILAAYGFENVVNLAGGLFAINPKI